MLIDRMAFSPGVLATLCQAHTIRKHVMPPLHLPFSSGDLVTLCRGHPLRERAYDAVVLERGRFELRCVVDFEPPGLSQGVWR